MTLHSRSGRARIRGVVAGSVAGVVLAVVAWVLPTPYYVLAPGAAYDTGKMVRVGDSPPHISGKLFMLAVTDRPANPLLWLWAKIDHRAELYPKEQMLQGYGNYQNYLIENYAAMADSQNDAKLVAEQILGYPAQMAADGVTVLYLLPDSKAGDLLQPGDVIVQLGKAKVAEGKDLLAAMKGVTPGQKVSVRIRRGDKEQVVEVPTYARSDEPTRALIGFRQHDHRTYSLPVPVTFDTGAIEGPSAGMMFTLQIVAQLQKAEDITHGWTIAGTGTISADHTVGEIGAIRQKVYTAEAAGAQVMFVPRANYKDATAVARSIRVVPVDRVDDAVQWLHEHATGPSAFGN